MTQLNRADQQHIDNNNQTVPTKKLSDTIVKSFNDTFEKAQSSKKSEATSQTSETSFKDSEVTSKSKELSKKSLELTQSDNMFHHLFPELGISQTQHIERMIISISKRIEQTISTPSSETFLIKLDQHQYNFKITIANQALNNRTIKLSCDENLCKLLTTYLPELKKFLRKKSISFSDLIIEMDESLENQNPD